MATESNTGRIPRGRACINESKTKYVPLYRTPELRPGHLFLTGQSFEILPTHYVDGRTGPHFDGDCIGCAKNIGVRPKLYMSAVTKSEREICLFECPASMVDQLEEWERIHSRLRGAELCCFRAGPKRNSRVRIRMRQSGIPDSELPPPFSVIAQICRIWQVEESRFAALEDSTQRTEVRISTHEELIRLNARMGLNHVLNGSE